MAYILECADSNLIKEVIYSGTAGWTPQVGRVVWGPWVLGSSMEVMGGS